MELALLAAATQSAVADKAGQPVNDVVDETRSRRVSGPAQAGLVRTGSGGCFHRSAGQTNHDRCGPKRPSPPCPFGTLIFFRFSSAGPSVGPSRRTIRASQLVDLGGGAFPVKGVVRRAPGNTVGPTRSARLAPAPGRSRRLS